MILADGKYCCVAKAIELNPSYAKAYYRRGLCQLAILRPTDAVPDFQKALHIEPGNKSIREQLQMTVKLIRRIEFEKVCLLPSTYLAASLELTEACRPSRLARQRPHRSSVTTSSPRVDAR